jgi:hypothetical protein
MGPEISTISQVSLKMTGLKDNARIINVLKSFISISCGSPIQNSEESLFLDTLNYVGREIND